ncbi:MAG: hypothetical protein HC902_11895 [Calothrix sp. SM1_5_4]|nr:hypothetical protein [Calothrix sp. SM1_5_4]
MRTREHEDLLEHLGQLCSLSISHPDAGLWEVRDGWQEHTFSNLMCWAGLERIARIQGRGYLRGLKFDVAAELARAEAAVNRAIKDQVLRNGPSDESLDCSLALAPILRFPAKAVGARTIDRIREELSGRSGQRQLLL